VNFCTLTRILHTGIVNQQRRDLIAAALRSIHEYHDRLAAAGRGDISSGAHTSTVLCINRRRECYFMQRGSLLCELESAGLGTDKTVDSVYISMNHLQARIADIEIRVNDQCKTGEHEELSGQICDGFGQVQKAVALLGSDLDSFVSVEQESHMEEQRQKLNVVWDYE
jgi:tetrahydromethanopterin S-methyltransferase subunit B